MMTKGPLLQAYDYMSAEDRRAFDRWMKANVVVGSLFAAALVAMALAGSKAPGPSHAMATGSQATELSASQKPAEDSAMLSVYELTIRLAPDQLPVQQVDEPF